MTLRDEMEVGTKKHRHALNLVERKSLAALKQANGKPQEARHLLWCWAKQDAELRGAMVRGACFNALDGPPMIDMPPAQRSQYGEP